MDLTHSSCLFILLSVPTILVHSLPEYVIPSKYILNIHVDPDKDVFEGTSNIYFTTIRNLTELQMHANPKKIKIPLIFLDTQQPCAVKSADNDTEIITIICPSNISAFDEHLISLHYQGTYSEPGEGIFKSSYEESGFLQIAVGTQMEPAFARRVFPCFDEPRFKTIFDVTVSHPESYSVVGNTKIISEYTLDDHIGTVFNTTPEMSTYMLAFVVSKFSKVEVKDGSTNVLSIYTRPDAVSLTETAVKYGPDLIDQLSEWTKIDYFTMGNVKMDFVALELLPSEAMENWGLITFEEMYQLDEGGNTTVAQENLIVTLIAHELAHQWFGNLVTLDWWSNTWLNEAFATYLQYHIPALIKGFECLESVFVSEVVQSVLLKDSFPSSPLSDKAEDIQTQEEMQDKFDEISYNKGASVLRMLTGIMGKGNFRQGTRTYLQANSYRNVNPNKLLESLENSYSSTDYPLKDIMDSYFYKQGYPLVTVTLTDNKSVHISQEKFSIVHDSDEENSTWYVPVSYTTSGEANFTVTIKEWLKPKENLTIDIKNDAWIILNLQQTGYYRVNYDDTLWTRLIEVLKTDPKKIDVLNRAQLIDDIFNVARTGRVSYGLVLRLSEYLQNEEEYYPWVSYFNGLTFILDQIDDNETVNLLKKSTLKWLNLSFPGKTITNKSTDRLSVLKNALISGWKCFLEDSDCLLDVKQSYKDYKNSLSMPDYNQRGVILCNSLRYSETPEEDFKFLLDVFKGTDSAYARRVMLYSFGCSENSTVLSSYLAELLSDKSSITQQEAFSAFEAIVKSGNNGVDIILNALENNATYICQKILFNNGFYTLVQLLDTLVPKINSEERLSKLQNIISSYEKKDIEYLQEFGDVANRTVVTNLAWAKKYNADIKNVLENLNNGASGERHFTLYFLVLCVCTSVLSVFIF